MPSRFYFMLLVLFLAILACATPISEQQVPVPDVLPSATPFIGESYPTAAAAGISS